MLHCGGVAPLVVEDAWRFVGQRGQGPLLGVESCRDGIGLGREQVLRVLLVGHRYLLRLLERLLGDFLGQC